METGDVAYLHDGTAVLVLEAGEGEPGGYEGVGPQARWVDNPDYKPARVARLVAEDVEQGQLAASLDETAAVGRANAIEAGTLAEQSQYVHEPATAPVNDAPVAEAPLGATVAEPALAADDAELRDDWQSVAEREGWQRPGTPSTQGGVPVTATSGPAGGGAGVGAGASATAEVGAPEPQTASEGQPASATSEGSAAGTPAQETPQPAPPAPPAP